MSEFKIDIDSKGINKTIKVYNWRGENFDKFLSKGIEKGLMPIQRLLKSKYLSGGILNVQTGRLRSSVKTSVENKNKVVFGIIGTNVRYAPVHEFGFSGSVQVPAYLRRSASGTIHSVRAHSKYISFRERAPFRRAVQDRSKEFSKILLRTLMNGLGKKKVKK